MRTLFSCVKINKKYLAGLLVLMMIGTVAEMMLPTLLATMIDKGIAEESRSYIITIAIIMAVMAVITCVANIVTTALSAKYPQALRPVFGRKSFTRCRIFRLRTWTGLGRLPWLPEVPRMSRMCSLS